MHVEGRLLILLKLDGPQLEYVSGHISASLKLNLPMFRLEQCVFISHCAPRSVPVVKGAPTAKTLEAVQSKGIRCELSKGLVC